MKVLSVEGQPILAGPIVEVIEEQSRQVTLWGEQNHEDIGDRPDHLSFAQAAEWWKLMNETRVELDSVTWDGILLEEVYEALAESQYGSRREELLQVAAVATAMVEALDRTEAKRRHDEARRVNITPDWVAADVLDAITFPARKRGGL